MKEIIHIFLFATEEIDASGFYCLIVTLEFVKAATCRSLENKRGMEAKVGGMKRKKNKPEKPQTNRKPSASLHEMSTKRAGFLLCV